MGSGNGREVILGHVSVCLTMLTMVRRMEECRARTGDACFEGWQAETASHGEGDVIC